MTRQTAALQKIAVFVLSIILIVFALTSLLPATAFAGTIDPEDGKIVLERTDIQLSTYSYAYNGQVRKPTATVVYNSTTLVEGVDYEIEWPKNLKEAGEKVVRVIGKGAYKGTAERSYYIYSLDAFFMIHPTAREGLIYDGTEQILINPGVNYMGKAVYSLEKDGDYSQALPTAKEAGVYTVWYYLQSEGYENDSTKYSLTVEIKKGVYDLSNLALEDKTVLYDGKSYSLALTGTLPNGLKAVFSNSNISEIGTHEITATIMDGEEIVQTLTATLTIKRPTLTFDIDNNNEDDVILTSSVGFEPDSRLEVKLVPESSYSKYNLDKYEQVEKAFDVKLVQNGNYTQPQDTATLKLLIPEDLRGEKFKILQVDGSNTTSVSYKIEGNYAVITTNKINESVFIYEQISLLWVIYLLIGIILIEIIILIMAISKQKGKSKPKSVKTYSFAPFILASFIAGGELAFVIALSVAAVGLVVGNVHIYKKNKELAKNNQSATEVETIETPSANAPQPTTEIAPKNTVESKIDNAPKAEIEETPTNKVIEESISQNVEYAKDVQSLEEPVVEEIQEEKSEAYNTLFVEGEDEVAEKIIHDALDNETIEDETLKTQTEETVEEEIEEQPKDELESRVDVVEEEIEQDEEDEFEDNSE
ncbi:MAG: hypothetical protein IJ981_02900, partial [Clostridia bacterium]|nr:hypothetical protein [Clostridia bacterium]